MSTFTCEVVRVKIINHPNADKLEIAMIGDYQSIVKKEQFEDGDLAVYIPEQAIVPQWMLEDMSMWNAERGKGELNGALGNRVKAIKLRGVVSQGLVYGGLQARDDELSVMGESDAASFKEGDDVAEFLGITKYEPAIPSHMMGRVVGVDLAATHKYDFDNLKKMPDLFEDGENVVITEKIHGCISEGTLISLPDGTTIPIEIVVSDPTISSVISYDIVNNIFIERRITGRMSRSNVEEKNWIRLFFDNGIALTLTEDHPVYSRSRGCWVEAKNVQPDEDIESLDVG